MSWTSGGTQSGTDTSLSSITSVTGVTVSVSANGHKTYQVPTTVTLLTITGTLSWDSDYETLECSESTRIEINAGAITTIGTSTTINGKVRYSKGTGLIMNKQQGSPFINTSSCNIWVKASTSLSLGGKFIINGCRIMSGGGIFLGNSTTPTNNFVTFTMNGGAVMQNISTTQTMQMVRAFCEPSGININQGTIDGRTLGGIPFSNAGWGTLAMSLEFGNFQCDGNGPVSPVTVPDATLVNNVNINDYSYVANSNDKTKINKYIFKNSDVGSLLRTLGQTGTTWRLGVVEIRKDVIFKVSDTSGTSIENAVVYSKLLGASLNPSSGSRYDGIDNYTTPRVYINSTASTGLTASTDILYAVAQGYATDATNAGTALTMDSLTSKASDIHDGNYIWSYNHLVGQPSASMRGIGTLTQAWTLFTDTDVTLSRTAALAKLASSFTINTSTKIITVTANSTYDDLYDIQKAYKCSTTQAQIESPIIGQTIITADGSTLTAYTGWTLVINTGVTLSTGTKFTKIYFDTITLNGTGKITAVYQTTVGTSTVLQLNTLSNGYSLCLYQGSTTKFFASNVNSGSTYVYLSPSETGTYTLAAENYGEKRTEDTLVLNGGDVWYNITDIQDVGISQTTKATVAAYTTIDNHDEFYDYTAYKRLEEIYIKLGDIAVRNGDTIDVSTPYSIKINQSASRVYDLATNIFTIKTTAYANGTKYTNMTLVPPATLTPTTNEVITADFEDANGNSSLTTLGGDGVFELWKITTSTPTDDYATGTLLATIGNEKFRFVSDVGYDIVGRDTNSGVRRRTSMDKGVYTQSFYVGDQIQLAQAPTVELIYDSVQAITVDIEAVKGTGFTKDVNSLINISNDVKTNISLSA